MKKSGRRRPPSPLKPTTKTRPDRAAGGGRCPYGYQSRSRGAYETDPQAFDDPSVIPVLDFIIVELDMNTRSPRRSAMTSRLTGSAGAERWQGASPMAPDTLASERGRSLASVTPPELKTS